MAGTAAGAAAARERQRLKREAAEQSRAGLLAAMPDGASLPDGNLPVVNVPTVQGLMSGAIEQAGVHSADYVLRVVSGSVRVPAAIRVSTALRVLEFNGFGQRDRPPPGDEDGAVGAWIQAAVKAAELRRLKASASDADVIDSTARDVTPAPASESDTQQSGK